MGWRITELSFSAVLASVASAAPIMSYEADVLPENDGWTASATPDGPVFQTRSIQGGVFTIDAAAESRAKVTCKRKVQLDASDQIVYDWSARVSNDDGASYVDLILEGPTRLSEMLISWKSDWAYISLSPNASVPVWTEALVTLPPGEFHTYRVESDGAAHTVYIDGTACLSADLQPASGLNVRTQFGFTKDFPNIPTRAEWDYFRISSIPEPASIVLFVSVLMIVTRRRPHTAR